MSKCNACFNQLLATLSLFLSAFVVVKLHKQIRIRRWPSYLTCPVHLSSTDSWRIYLKHPIRSPYPRIQFRITLMLNLKQMAEFQQWNPGFIQRVKFALSALLGDAMRAWNCPWCWKGVARVIGFLEIFCLPKNAKEYSLHTNFSKY